MSVIYFIFQQTMLFTIPLMICLLYTSDAADE